MTIACTAPDETLGAALRLSTYLDCQAQALGQNGFEALTGGPIVSGLMSGVVTIFVALIGYRFLLGALPTLRDGIGWAVRLGIVLTLTTSWPAFQTLVYDVVTRAPADLAGTLLPAIGVSPLDPGRIENAYEIVGHGMSVGAEVPPPPVAPGAQAGGPAPASQPMTIGFPPSPIAASLLVLSSLGIVSALRIVVGLLTAIGPLAVIGLLFDNTLGLLTGWIRALVGAALGVLGTTVASMLELVLVESEIGRIRDVQAGLLSPDSADPAAFVTIAAVFGLIALVMVYASFRAASGLRLSFAATAPVTPTNTVSGGAAIWSSMRSSTNSRAEQNDRAPSRSRADGVSDALAAASQRDARMRDGFTTAVRPLLPPTETRGIEMLAARPSLGQSGRRTSPRRTGSAARRDRSA